MENQSTPLSIALVTRPAQRVIGMVIRTAMATAPADCKKLWSETFAPRMHEIESARPCESYGISWMAQEPERSGPPAGSAEPDACIFDYWAAMPVDEKAPVPDGMRECYLPEGVYAECHVASLAALGNAYSYIYEKWLPEQTQYTLDPQGVCYELYPADFSSSGRLVLYFAATPL